MTNISILAWNDSGGVTKIHNIITNDTSIEWITEYVSTKNIFWAVCKIFRILTHRNASRVLVGNGREALIVWIFVFLTRKKIKVFYVQHTPLDQTPKYFRMFFKIVCRDFTVITISNELRKRLIKFLPAALHNIKVIYNPVLETQLKEIHLQEIRGPINILAIGRLTYQKNYKFMINLIKYLNSNGIEANLKILGHGEDHDLITKQIKELKLNQNVSLAGYCNNVTDHLNETDFFIMTSHWEGLPTALIEALNSSARIVAYKCPTGVEEILTSQPATRTIDKLDYDTFYQAIRELKQIEGHFTRDMTKFNREYNLRQYEELFDVHD
ncbi:glycosyltransferase [Lentibacter algarum]|uniref:glycosyltransferase n=1 Tax=Lentibacter algarum TaxID=576131 RepID=UPI0024911A66|nr:glycosyltransferase [Lentibacter algarum]